MSESNPRNSAIETAQELEEDLEAIADSNLPFATDAQAILSEIKDNE